jgi:SAM-dependent methyltransferase
MQGAGCVFSDCFLSALADPGPILGEIRRVLRPGGHLGLSDMYLRGPDAAPSCGSAAARGAALLAARPGYYLLVAEAAGAAKRAPVAGAARAAQAAATPVTGH